MRLNRRNFLEGALACSALVTLGGALRQAAFAAEPVAQAPMLVFVHMRGACDGLNLVCPANDPSLIAARPAELRVADSGDKAGHSVPSEATPKIDWRLHFAAPGLAELYRAKTLAFVHAAGIPERNRSHFVANDIMDRGAAGSGALGHASNGWLARYLGPAPLSELPHRIHVLAQQTSRLPAVSTSGSLAGEFAGFDGAFAVGDLANGLPLPFDEKAAGAVEMLYAQAQGTAGPAGIRALEAAKLIASKLPRDAGGKFVPYTEQKEAYDKAGDIGRGLRTVARLIKADTGLEVASVDCGGWDTHEGQPGRFQGNVQRLSSALGAFWNDVSAYHGRVTVVAYSEFGRRLRANKSAGTDHGRGGVMIAMGAGVKGGRILGPWPGLEEAALEERVDLAVKTDYRQVLTELLEYHSGQPLNAAVFPGYKAPPPVGIFS